MKKLLAFVLVAAMAVGALSACGSNANTDTANGDAAGSKGSIMIGCTGPLTGDASSYGISVQKGAQLAVDTINAAGGLNGITFTFEMKDDKATPEEAGTGYESLYDAGMKISLGSVTSGACKAFAEKAQEDRIFALTPSASEQAVIEKGDCIFRVCFGDPDQGTLAAEELTTTFSNIGVIYDKSDSYSSGIFAAFETKMNELGKTFTVQTFDKEHNKDFSTQVEALKDCDVIFMPFYYTEAGLVAKACSAKGVTAELFGCDGFDGIADQLDSTVTNKIRYITPFDANSTEEVSAKFVSDFKAKYNETPDQFAADGYDAVYAIYNAMKAANVSDASIEAEELTDLVIAAITGADFSYKGATGTMTWDKSGACTKIPVIVEFGA